MLPRLRPRNRLVRGDDQEGAVHQKGSREHVRHQALVARRVDEADSPQQVGRLSADWTGRARRVGGGDRGVLTLVEGRVRVSDLDRDSPSQLLAVCGGPDAGDSLYDTGLTGIHVPRGPDVALRLLWNDRSFRTLFGQAGLARRKPLLRFALIFCFQHSFRTRSGLALRSYFDTEDARSTMNLWGVRATFRSAMLKSSMSFAPSTTNATFFLMPYRLPKGLLHDSSLVRAH